jgi:hypothetical protein
MPTANALALGSFTNNKSSIIDFQSEGRFRKKSKMRAAAPRRHPFLDFVRRVADLMAAIKIPEDECP